MRHSLQHSAIKQKNGSTSSLACTQNYLSQNVLCRIYGMMMFFSCYSLCLSLLSTPSIRSQHSHHHATNNNEPFSSCSCKSRLALNQGRNMLCYQTKQTKLHATSTLYFPFDSITSRFYEKQFAMAQTHTHTHPP